jgi:hypothetical protein
MSDLLKRFIREEEGQDLVEYALLLSRDPNSKLGGFQPVALWAFEVRTLSFSANETRCAIH